MNFVKKIILYFQSLLCFIEQYWAEGGKGWEDRGVIYYFLAMIVDLENLYVVLQYSKFHIEILYIVVLLSDELIYFRILFIYKKMIVIKITEAVTEGVL